MTEKARFRVQRENGEAVECYLDGERLEPFGDVFILQDQEKDFRLSEIPEDVRLLPVAEDELDRHYVDLPSIEISRYQNGRAVVSMEFAARYREWDEEPRLRYWQEIPSLSQYGAALRQALGMRFASTHDGELVSFDEADLGIRLQWNLILAQDLEAHDALTRIEEAYEEVTALADQIVYGYNPSRGTLKDEEKYTKRVVIPLLISMGFQDIHYTHGQAEFGKDVTFSRLDEFSILKHYGAQIKLGNISGEAKSEIDELIGQIEDAFAMPYVSLYGKDKRYISALYIITSGKFTSNAQEKIINKVSQPAVRSNVIFLDGEKVTELVERFAHRSAP